MTVLMKDVTPDMDAAFTTVFLHEQRRVRALAARYLSTVDPALAEDLAQEAFAQLWKVANDGYPVTNAEALLSTMTRHAVGRHFRLARNTRERAADFTDAVTSLRMPADRSAEDVAVARESVRDALTGAR
jgi:DNA-directed RNA polymerase specialized sigma24 family protein